MNLKQRSYEKELLDQDDIPFEHIRQNMQELDFINTWLGGHVISIEGLKMLLDQRKQLLVCEIGCGGGDSLVALQRWCSKNNITARFIGIDIKSACIAFAKSRLSLAENTTWLQCDYREAVFPQMPDIIFSSLFCHHFTNEELIAQLQWMRQNSVTGFFINDLERNKLAYLLIKSLTKMFSASYLVKNDAPISVARSFKKQEWLYLLQQAGIKHYAVHWKWAFRYLVTSKHE